MVRWRKTILGILGAVGLAVPVLTAGGPAWAAHDTLTIGVSQFPPNFNPLINATATQAYTNGMVLRPFTQFDKDWKLVCMLCTELPTIENGKAVPEKTADGKPGVALTYTIRPDAKWGDGTPVTTADVTFTWEVGKNPQSGVSDAELFKRITAVDVKDDHTFTLHENKLDFDYNEINDFQVLPAHLEKAAFADPASYRNRSIYETDPTNPGLYYGPYRVTQVQRGQFIVLEPNPTWWGKKPYFKKVVVKTVETTPALEASLLSGEIDMVAGEIGFTLDAALAFETRKRPEWTVIYKPALAFEQLSPNMDNPILADKRVRQALLYGLNRQALIQQVYQGKQIVADTDVNPLDWCYDPNVKKYPYDPAKAEALLAEAGWKKGPDGKLVNAAGKPLNLEIMTTAGNRNREVTEIVIQEAWKRLGITVTLRNQPARTLFGEAVLKHAYPDFALFAWFSSPENVPVQTLRSDQVPTAANGFSGENSGGYKNPEMDKLLDAIDVELDKTKRAALWKQFQQMFADDLPMLPITYRSDPYVLPVWLKGVEPTGHQAPTTLWIENWHEG
ncbi:MAG TPA: peptide ABC transporter substrate-binding protein [Magnetospirillaceae bacterium]|jgi:peptide/nickel transport system substrate-binding protein